MGDQTNIAWCDKTFSPWIGCTKVSDGCKNCYADEMDRTKFSKTLGGGTKEKPISHWGKGAPRYRTSEEAWKKPLKWNKDTGKNLLCLSCVRFGKIRWDAAIGGSFGKCQGCGKATHLREFKIIRPKVFFSLADPFDDEVPIEWLADYLKLIRYTPNLDWLLLTKRPENWRDRMAAVLEFVFNKPATYPNLWEWLYRWTHKKVPTEPTNIWLGTSVENQDQDRRITELLKIPAKVRFLSCEPLLSKLSLVNAYSEGFSVCSVRKCTHWGEWDAIRECVDCKCREENPINGDCSKCSKGTMRNICPKCETNNDSDCYEHPRDFATGYEIIPGIHWVIVGGESGPKRREMTLEWMTSLYDQCKAAGVPFFAKQASALRPGQQGDIPDHIWNTKEFPKV